MYYNVDTIIIYNLLTEGDDIMAQEATLSIRVDEADKRKFEAFCMETGMNMSVAVNMFIKYVIREQKFPFEVTTISKTDIEKTGGMEEKKKAAARYQAYAQKYSEK